MALALPNPPVERPMPNSQEAQEDQRQLGVWRNDGGAWSNEHQMSLGQVGQHEYIARLKRLGQYRVRQYEFGHTDDSDFILISAEELIEGAIS